jgi:putative Mg2+ transporter-C (MgtC) family protein
MNNDLFFGFHIPSQSVWGMAAALLLSVAVGGAIGLEREIHGHPAGLRTHILVCLGATLITLVSVRMGLSWPGKADPGRIAAQVVVGIGFLGAGAIVREGATIRGLTTAASIWTTAAIGIALGAGPFYGQLALITAVIVLFTLSVLNLLEERILAKLSGAAALDIHIADAPEVFPQVLACLARHQVAVRSVDYETGPRAHVRQLVMQVTYPSGLDRNTLLADLMGVHGVVAVSFL